MSRENREARRAKWKERRAHRKPLLRPLDENDREALMHLKETIDGILTEGWEAEDARDLLVDVAELVTARRDTP